jgi:hypothetical protein
MIDFIFADIEIASIFAHQPYTETDKQPRSETSPLSEFTLQDIHNNNDIRTDIFGQSRH